MKKLATGHILLFYSNFHQVIQERRSQPQFEHSFPHSSPAIGSLAVLTWKKVCFSHSVQEFIEIKARLPLTFLICSHNQ